MINNDIEPGDTRGIITFHREDAEQTEIMRLFIDENGQKKITINAEPKEVAEIIMKEFDKLRKANCH